MLKENVEHSHNKVARNYVQVLWGFYVLSDGHVWCNLFSSKYPFWQGPLVSTIFQSHRLATHQFEAAAFLSNVFNRMERNCTNVYTITGDHVTTVVLYIFIYFFTVGIFIFFASFTLMFTNVQLPQNKIKNETKITDKALFPNFQMTLNIVLVLLENHPLLLFPLPFQLKVLYSDFAHYATLTQLLQIWW